MLQIATFQLPEEQDQANEFLRTHKPIGNIEFSKDILFMGYEDGEYSVEYQIDDLNDMIRSNRAARLQQEIALTVLAYELKSFEEERDGVNMKNNAKQFEQLTQQIMQHTAAIANTKRSMTLQDVKAAWAFNRINELKAGKQ